MTSTNTGDRATEASTRKPRRMAREPKQAAATGAANTIDAAKTDKAPSKLDTVAALLLAATGASIAELVAATGWQQHSVRGAMAGALKKRGLVITSDKIDGIRRYRAEKPA
jgi:hypothetical protein